MSSDSRPDGESGLPAAAGPQSADTVDVVMESLGTGAVVVDAGWLSELRDFKLRFQDGRELVFRDCLQVNLVRPPASEQEPLTLGSWWSDEPSPLVLSLGPEIRLLYQHLVIELGEVLLRVACRRVEAASV